MQDELKLIRQRDRGLRAEAIYNDELFREIFQAQEREYIDKWSASKPEDIKEREIFWVGVNVLRDIQDRLKGIVSQGKVARHDIEQIRKAEEAAKKSSA